MPERDFPYGNRGYPRERTTYGSGGVGFDRLRLAPRDVRCGVPQGAQFIREWGGYPGPSPDGRLARLTPSSTSGFSSCSSAAGSRSNPTRNQRST